VAWVALLVWLAGAALAADPLLGRWQYPDGTVMEFAKGGVLTLRSPGKEPERLHYWVEEDSSLIMVSEEQTMIVTFALSRDGKLLTIYGQERPGQPPQVLERTPKP
jgi:hypothetical protein